MSDEQPEKRVVIETKLPCGCKASLVEDERYEQWIEFTRCERHEQAERAMSALGMVTVLIDANRSTWRDKPEGYWLQRLLEEFGELGAALAGDHADPPDWELAQIASICTNWLDMRCNGPVPQVLVERLERLQAESTQGR